MYVLGTCFGSHQRWTSISPQTVDGITPDEGGDAGVPLSCCSQKNPFFLFFWRARIGEFKVPTSCQLRWATSRDSYRRIASESYRRDSSR